MDSLLDLGLPVLRLLDNDVRDQLDWWLHDTDRQGDTISFTKFVPGVVFDVAAECILNVDQLTLDRCRKCIEHDSLIGVSMSDMRLMLVVGWDRDLISTLNLCLCGASWCLKDCHVGRMACRPLSIIFAKMLAMKLEFKAAYRLLTS